MENNNNSNEPIILGTLKKEKSSKPLFVLIVFIFILGICFLLPSISDYMANNDNAITRFYNNYISGIIENNNGGSSNINIQRPISTTTKKLNIKSLITCTLNNDKYVYNFNDDKLISINHTFTYSYSENSNDYFSKYDEYKSMTTFYNTINFIAEVKENDNGFEFNNTIDLTKAKPSTIKQYNNSNYFDFNKNKKDILEELNDKGFECV